MASLHESDGFGCLPCGDEVKKSFHGRNDAFQPGLKEDAGCATGNVPMASVVPNAARSSTRNLLIQEAKRLRYKAHRLELLADALVNTSLGAEADNALFEVVFTSLGIGAKPLFAGKGNLASGR